MHPDYWEQARKNKHRAPLALVNEESQLPSSTSNKRATWPERLLVSFFRGFDTQQLILQ
jgi:hypothetical protein